MNYSPLKVEYYFTSGFNWVKCYHVKTEIEQMVTLKYFFIFIVYKVNVISTTN
jgi:hypothetical protein